MKTTKYYMFFLLSLVFLFISISSSHAGTDFNLSGQWPKVSAGPDPGQPDTVYLECLTQSSQQIIQVRLKTDNVGVEDSILGCPRFSEAQRSFCLTVADFSLVSVV